MCNRKKVFLLGPSHHYHLSNCALSRCTKYSTPLGDLPIDLDTVSELRKTGLFSDMSIDNDEAEHSLEMHLPYIYKMLSKAFPSGPESFPKLVPILVGSTSESTERDFGKLLAKYVADPDTFWVISSDFCHWGLRFRYTYYDASPFSPDEEAASKKSTGTYLKANASSPSPAIHESIAWTDMASMYSIELSGHKGFTEELHRTGNTVCGRHPIGVMMAALEEHLKDDETGDKGKFKFVRYERSSLVKRVNDSSVSYASAYAIF
jgi:AmmeMemoRadiSam system protein B